MQKLPLAQQLIAAGNTDRPVFAAPLLSRAKLWLQAVRKRLVHFALWWVHGMPGNLPGATQFTMGKLAEKCGEVGWPFLLAENLNDARVVEFVRQQKPELAIFLGQLPLSPELLAVPSRGWIRVCQSVVQHNETNAKEGHEIKIEYLARDSDTVFTIARLTLPFEAYDGLAGSTLKADLISDDLLVQTAVGLQTASQAEASKAVAEWMQRIFLPYLRQLRPVPIKTRPDTPRPPRFRPAWKLCLDTLFLCSPFVAGRNWYRRCCGRYPVLILTHHLVSDRPHRMAIPTEFFWQQVLFLQRQYRIVSLTEAVELLASRGVKAPTVVLTFDDGYRDNFVSLRAVAEETGVPVALFIATQPVATHQEFQHDLAAGIRGALPLTWDQIRYWSLRGAEFGSHTRTHFDCGSTDRTTLEQEIIGSRNDLESHLGKPVGFFAFPFGKYENMSSEAVKVATSTYRHFASGLGGENLHDRAAGNQHLFRKGLYADPWELELELQSIFDLVDKIKRKLHLSRRESPSFPGAPSTARALTISTSRSQELKVSN
jgi:peptidoglycan/xylan/chitin deacetylase (PgdA/CDA1 family)